MGIADDRKRVRWERATGWPAFGASLLFLIAYSWAILDETPTPALTVTLTSILIAVWAFYVVDYAVRLTLAENKRSFVRHTPIDLFSVFLPLVRPFRLLTGLQRIPALRGNTAAHLRRRVIIIAGSWVIMFVYVISLAEFRIERYADGSNIRSFGPRIAALRTEAIAFGA